MSKLRIVLIGGGFAGIQCGRTLRRMLSSEEAELVLFNKENHTVFHPLLAEVAAAAIRPTDVCAPLRQFLGGIQCRTEEVLRIDLENQELEYEAENGLRGRMRYDQLVIAAGRVVNLAGVPGMADHGLPLKTIGDALAVQAHVMEMLEKAEVCEDPERKRAYLSFVVVGGGFSGVEIAGEINDLLRSSLRFFRNIARDECRVTVVHSGGQILPEVSPALREFARRKMEKNGIQFILGASAAVCTPEGVGIEDGRFLRSRTVISTIGTSPAPFVELLPLPKERGRLKTDADMRVTGCRNVWAIGDCAHVVNSADGNPSPPTAQFAERQGVQAARNIVARFRGRPTRPFAHTSRGTLCAIGGHTAVGELLGVRLSGFLAWFVWRGVYLVKLPSLAQKVKVGLAWGCDLVFPRTLAHLKADRTQRASRAFYRSGDLIFGEGDPASDFYVVKGGEVEILSQGDGRAGAEVIAVLRPGDFFGEGALIDGRPRRNSARARTNVEVLVLGGGVFNQLSTAFTPMKAVLGAALKRRTPIWQRFAWAREVLAAMPVGQFVERIEVEPLKPDTSLVEAIRVINRHRLDVCFVAGPGSRLAGLLTRGDLLRAIDVAATLSAEERASITVKDMMVGDPITISSHDTALSAVNAMREHGLTKLPVIEVENDRALKGYVRLENIMESVLRKRLALANAVDEGH